MLDEVYITTVSDAEEALFLVDEFYKAYLAKAISEIGLKKLSEKTGLNKSQFTRPLERDSLMSIRRVSLIINKHYPNKL